MMNSKHVLKVALYGGLMWMFTTLTHADVYKWVDKDGKVQYSDQPPLAGDVKKMKKKTVDTPSAASPSPNSAAKPATPIADQELEYRKRKAEKEEQEKKQQAEADTSRKNKEHCNNLRGELGSHSDGTRLIRYNDKGERVFLDEKERADSKRNLEERIAKECK